MALGTRGEASQSGEWRIALEESLNPQRKLIAELAHSEVLAEGDVARAIAQVTEVAARALRVERASVWRLCGSGAELALECVDLYERTKNQHASEAPCFARDVPRYFEALAGERAIAAHDAATDERTSEFGAGYLQRRGITAMLDAPVFVRGKMVGVVCHEHVGSPRRWHFWEELIAGTCADFVALVLEAQGWAAAEQALREQRDELERQVAERTAALSASEEGLRTLLDVTPVALVLTRARDNVVVFTNPRARSLFEVTDGDPTPFTAKSFWVDPDERERFLSSVGNDVVAGAEVQLKTQGGRTFWARTSARRIVYRGEDMMLSSVDDVTSQKLVEQRLRELATHDTLTGIHNRRSILDLGINEQERSRRYARTFVVAMIDVDHFKRVNDEHGHAAGDEVLRAVVEITNTQLRVSDMLGRWGGEEFVALLPETDLRAAAGVLERVRGAIAAKPIGVGGVAVPVTISLGLAEWTGIESFESLVERADQACYAAKRAGRNRVELAAPR